MFGRKGQGLPLNTIIIAIIVVVVLVVIILIFTGQLSGADDAFTTGNDDEGACSNTQSERCVASFQCENAAGNNKVCGAGTVCCSNIKEQYK